MNYFVNTMSQESLRVYITIVYLFMSIFIFVMHHLCTCTAYVKASEIAPIVLISFWMGRSPGGGLRSLYRSMARFVCVGGGGATSRVVNKDKRRGVVLSYLEEGWYQK